MPTIAANFAGSRIETAIASAAAVTGVDFNYLVSQARVESGLNPDARARTSTATGLYQFIEQSWLGTVARHGGEHGLGWAAGAIERGNDGRYRVRDPQLRQTILDLRRDPQAASAMAAELASDNGQALEARLGRQAEPVDLYLAHFLGLGGATKFLRAHASNDGQSAAALFPAAAGANRNVFYARDGSPRSLGEVRDRFAARFGNDRPMTQPLRFAAARTSAPALVQPTAPGNARLAYLMLASLGVS